MGWRLKYIWAWLRAHPRDALFGLVAAGFVVALLAGVVIFTEPGQPTGVEVAGEITSIRGHTDDVGSTTFSVYVELDGGTVVVTRSPTQRGLAIGGRVTLVEYEQALLGTRTYELLRPLSP